VVNPLNPNSVQHQISPFNINAQLSAQLLRNKEVITRDKLFCYLNNVSQLDLQQMYGVQQGELWHWGLKGQISRGNEKANSTLE